VPLTERRQWLETVGIGGSDVPAILGVSPFNTATDIWLKKLGESDPFVDNQYTRWGVLLEDDIAEFYRQENPGVELVESDTVERPHATRSLVTFCTPDRIVRVNDNGAVTRWGLECKNKGYSQKSKWGPSGSRIIPVDIAAQVYWSMWVTGMDRWDVAVLIGGNDWRQYSYEWVPALDEPFNGVAEWFWDHVERKTEPQNPRDVPVAKETVRLLKSLVV